MTMLPACPSPLPSASGDSFKIEVCSEGPVAMLLMYGRYSVEYYQDVLRKVTYYNTAEEPDVSADRQVQVSNTMWSCDSSHSLKCTSCAIVLY